MAALPTPSRSTLLRRLKARAKFAANTPATIGDEAFQASDQYLGKLCLFRKGRYVAGYGNLADGQDGVSLATALAARIP